jgi:hypothetical protein
MTIHRTTNDGDPVPQPDFNYVPTDQLAGVVIKAWKDENVRQVLLDRNGVFVTPKAADKAKELLTDAGYFLTRTVVITEDEYDNDYHAQAPDEVVFVLPNVTRVSGLKDHSDAQLLETAKLLMAATPNGI